MQQYLSRSYGSCFQSLSCAAVEACLVSWQPRTGWVRAWSFRPRLNRSSNNSTDETLQGLARGELKPLRQNASFVKRKAQLFEASGLLCSIPNELVREMHSAWTHSTCSKHWAQHNEWICRWCFIHKGWLLGGVCAGSEPRAWAECSNGHPEWGGLRCSSFWKLPPRYTQARSHKIK